MFSLNNNKKEKVFDKPDVLHIADVYWRRILRSFFVLLLLGTVGAVVLFLHISKVFESSLGSEGGNSSLVLDKEKLKEALLFAEEKQKTLEMAKQSLPETIDPSSTNSYSLEQ